MALLTEEKWLCLSGVFQLQHICNINCIWLIGNPRTRQERKCWSGVGFAFHLWPGHVCVEQVQQHMLPVLLQMLWLQREWVLSDTLSLLAVLSKEMARSPLKSRWNKGVRMMICLQKTVLQWRVGWVIVLCLFPHRRRCGLSSVLLAIRLSQKNSVCSGRDPVMHATLSLFWGFSCVLKDTWTKGQMGISSGVGDPAGKTDKAPLQNKVNEFKSWSNEDLRAIISKLLLCRPSCSCYLRQTSWVSSTGRVERQFVLKAPLCQGPFLRPIPAKGSGPSL